MRACTMRSFTCHVSDGGVGASVVHGRRSAGERVGKTRTQRNDRDAGHRLLQPHHAAQQIPELSG